MLKDKLSKSYCVFFHQFKLCILFFRHGIVAFILNEHGLSKRLHITVDMDLSYSDQQVNHCLGFYQMQYFWCMIAGFVEFQHSKAFALYSILSKPSTTVRVITECLFSQQAKVA